MASKDFSHRISTAKVRVTDVIGTPIANTPIEFELSNHEFLFGCGAFDSTFLYETKGTDKEAFFRERVDRFEKVFNYGTLPFYWGGYEPQEGNVQFESRMFGAQELRAHNITPKGHPLCWHTVCANWLLKYDNKTIMEKQLERINRDVTAFRGVVDIWDAINETVIMPEFDRYDNAVTRICNEYGRINLIKEVFAAAKAANPDSVLLINDFNLSDKYVKVIDECLEAGVPIDAIGLQTHQHQGYHGREWFEEVLERFSVFGLPLHFTENTLISGEIMPSHIVDLNDWQVDEWPSTPEGEARQAREWEEIYNTLFAHPLVEAVTGWDLSDGMWLNAPSGLIRKDNSVKPAYEKLDELIHKTWHTNVTLTTDDNGCVDLSGYRGEYKISAPQGSGSLVLKKNCPEIQVAIQ